MKSLAVKAACGEELFIEMSCLGDKGVVGTQEDLFVLNTGIGATPIIGINYSDLSEVVVVSGLLGLSTLVFLYDSRKEAVILKSSQLAELQNVIDRINSFRNTALPPVKIRMGQQTDVPPIEGGGAGGCLLCLCGILFIVWMVWPVFFGPGVMGWDSPSSSAPTPRKEVDIKVVGTPTYVRDENGEQIVVIPVEKRVKQ